MARGGHEQLLVGLDVADDAAVYRLSDDLALVVTLDFFTPIVDDPYAYGSIAAANSLSDIYAMGARPLFGLNIAALPIDLPVEVSSEILRGGAEKALEAGIPLVGGHTVQDAEPKYGLVVIGTIEPSAVTRKGGARLGDRLLLSKPLGSGVVTTGLMRDAATPDEVEAATKSMAALNRTAAEIALRHGASAVTDVTGFGLLGHASEMAGQGDVGFRFHYSSLPWLPGAERMARLQFFPGGAKSNRDHFPGPGSSLDIRFAEDLEEWQRLSMFSPETSGGLLFTLEPRAAQDALQEARTEGIELWPIGEVTEPGAIAVVD